MMQQDTTQQNPESGKGVAKQGSKFSATFWQERVFRPTYTRAGQRLVVAQWYARIKHGPRRESVGLATNSREEAGRKAARLYQTIHAKGWDAALAEFKPDSKPQCLTTVGDYLAAVKPIARVRGRTWDGYGYALRKIALDIAGDRQRDGSRFNPKTLVLRDRGNRIPLAKLTPASVEQWKMDFVNQAADPIAAGRARRSANSYLRCARALFSRRILKRLSELSVPLPSPLPFEGVELERQGNTRYVSTIDAGALLKAARKKLAGKDGDAWRVILLALGAGLRRSEIDMLCWTQIDFKRGEIRVLNHSTFEAKTDDSQGRIFVDAGLLSELKAGRSNESLFVIEPGTAAANRNGQYYRCLATFERVTAWLRKYGVLSDRPLHTLRKEFGSIIAEKADIHTASRQLRHSTITTTAAYYADHRKRETVGIGEMLVRKAAK
jgi:integrase